MIVIAFYLVFFFLTFNLFTLLFVHLIVEYSDSLAS